MTAVLDEAGRATLLFHPLTPTEEHGRDHVFDLDPLAGRLVDVSRRLRRQPDDMARSPRPEPVGSR